MVDDQRVTMENIELVDCNRKEIAIVFDVEVNKCLRHLRQLISEQVSDLMPSDEYFFVHEGMRVSEAKEHELTVLQIALSTNFDELGDSYTFPNVVITFDKSSDSRDSKPDIQDTEILQESAATSSRAPPRVSKPISMLSLRSPTSAELRGLKIFTEDEIKKGKGSQQTYREFWNKKIKEHAKKQLFVK